MGYLHIDNLYRHPEVFECYALEKIHGTSARINWAGGVVRFFCGGVPLKTFETLFDADVLAGRFASVCDGADDVTVYGEAFGGKCQKMSAVYGPVLRFLAFDVKIDSQWLDVAGAEDFVRQIGLGFVPYDRGPLTREWINLQRDRWSLATPGYTGRREGVVIRPIREYVGNNGTRWIVKHKRDDFRETKTPRPLDAVRQAVFSDALLVADEWVTPMRLTHVLDKTPYRGEQDTGAVIRAMVEDVKREANEEVVWSREVERAIGRATAKLLLALITKE